MHIYRHFSLSLFALIEAVETLDCFLSKTSRKLHSESLNLQRKFIVLALPCFRFNDLEAFLLTCSNLAIPAIRSEISFKLGVFIAEITSEADERTDKVASVFVRCRARRLLVIDCSRAVPE